MINRKKKVIIIGAGIGGLSAGARLLKKGYDVEIIEKNSCCGGKTGVIKKNGFTFDLTASIMMMPMEYRSISEELGLNLELIKLDPNYRVNYSDGTVLDFYTDPAATLQQLEHLNHGNKTGYLKFLCDGYQRYQTAYQSFLNRNFDSLGDLLCLNTIKGLALGNPFTSSYHYISKHIKDEKIRNFLAFQAMYIGVDPFKSPNLYTLIPVVSAVEGLWYLKGGLHSFVKSMEDYVRNGGGTIVLDTTVRKILIKNNKAYGVATDQGDYYGDLVVCNSDYTYSRDTFFDRSVSKSSQESGHERQFQYSCSVFMAYLGLKKKYDSLRVHNIFLSSAFKKNMQAAFKGKIPAEPSFYLYCPSRIDSTMAPEGKDGVNVMIRIPNTLECPMIWNEKQMKKMKKCLIESLQKIKGLEDIQENIEFERYLTPMDLEEKFNSYYGNAFGIGHSLTQTAFLRPQIKSREFDDLYFIGDSVHPGTGVSLILLGSKLLCEYF